MVERLILMLASSAFVGLAQAQPLADPTRPPAEGPADRGREEARAPSRLQSVLISSRRSVAVIDGRAVQLGERLDGARVVSIEPAQVTLQRGSVRERLTLLPTGIEKKPVRP